MSNHESLSKQQQVLQTAAAAPNPESECPDDHPARRGPQRTEPRLGVRRQAVCPWASQTSVGLSFPTHRRGMDLMTSLWSFSTHTSCEFYNQHTVSTKDAP